MREELEIVIQEYLEAKGFDIRRVDMPIEYCTKEDGKILEIQGSYWIRAKKNA